MPLYAASDNNQSIQNIEMTLQDISSSIQKLSDKVTELEKEIQSKINKQEKTTKQDAAAIEKQYQQSFSLLEGDKLEEARKAFSTFILNFPHSSFSARAYYWLGEIDYLQNNFKEARSNFLKSYNADNKGSKAAASLARLALTLKRLNRIDEACTMLDTLYREFSTIPLPIRQNPALDKLYNECT